MVMDQNNIMIVVVFSVLCILTLTSSVPLQHVQRRSITMDKAHDWLQKFGYMGSDSHNPTESEITEGMRSMQRFYGLSDTGALDQDTMDMMSEPRCGVADVQPDIVPPGNRRRRYSILGDPWDATALSYRFNNYTPDLTRSQIRSAIERALGVWADVTPLSFSRRSDGTSTQIGQISDIEIVFGSGNHGIFHQADGPFDGDSRAGGSVLAHAFNPGMVNRPDLRGDMHFDEDELWQDAAGIDLFTVAAHEFGHSLGLGHSNVRGALMFPTYYGYDPNFQLHSDDIAGIQSLYGPAPPRPKPPTPKPPTMKMPSTIAPVTSAGTTTTVQTTTRGPDYCDVFSTVDTVATLYEIQDEAFTVATMGSEQVLLARDGVLSDPVTFPLDRESFQRSFNAIWEDSVDPVNAMVEKQDGSLVVFRGNMYWEYSPNDNFGFFRYQLKPGNYPKSVTSLGLPTAVEVMAALHDRNNATIHLFSSILYWTFDANLNILDSSSPNSIDSRWPEPIPRTVDAAFQWQDQSCFVKDTEYWCFNETSSEVGLEYPRPFNVDWLGCTDITGSYAPSTKPTVTLILSVLPILSLLW